jgi:hypothetical protein
MEMGAGAQGNAALGGASPTALALDRQNRLDETAEDAAKGYQETAAGLVSGALSDEGDLSRLDQTRRLGVLGATQGVYQNGAQHAPRSRSGGNDLCLGLQVGLGRRQRLNRTEKRI